MIPKRIHYCWFGGNPLSDETKRYINTWRNFCPDYEIIEWNESNFDVTENDYCREAYGAKKWAFVTDYVRLKVLYDYGGIYMDTDVEVCKSLDPLLECEAVSGYESDTRIPTGTMAACRGNEWIGILLHDYDNRHFIRMDGSYDTTTNVETITRLTKDYYAIELNGNKITFGNNIVILPFEVLCAKSLHTGDVNMTEETLTIHHFAGSWLSDEYRKRNNIYQKYYRGLSLIHNEYFRRKFAAIISCYKMGGRYILDKICKKIIGKQWS